MALSRKQLRLIENNSIIGIVLVMGMNDTQINTIISNARANISELPPIYRRFFTEFIDKETADTEPYLGRFEHEQETNPTIPGE